MWHIKISHHAEVFIRILHQGDFCFNTASLNFPLGGVSSFERSEIEAFRRELNAVLLQLRADSRQSGNDPARKRKLEPPTSNSTSRLRIVIHNSSFVILRKQ
jgi:hypothetical protein